MLDRDMQALARFQSSTPGIADHCIFQLENVVDQLTDLAKTRDGIREIRLHRESIKQSLIKLHDIYLEFSNGHA